MFHVLNDYIIQNFYFFEEKLDISNQIMIYFLLKINARCTFYFHFIKCKKKNRKRQLANDVETMYITQKLIIMFIV